jgi:hypothetical protein
VDKFNGWENRETWLVNVYFGDSFYTYMEEQGEHGIYDKYEIAIMYKEYVENLLEEEMENLNQFLNDYIDFGYINWQELAENVLYDLTK